MGIYIFSLISIIVCPLIFYGIKKVDNNIIKNIIDEHKLDDNKILVTIIGIQLFFISAFRAQSVGTDLARYLPRFERIAKTRWSEIFSLRDVVDFEYGYILFNKIVGVISDNRQVLLIITSGIIVFSFSYFIYKYSKHPWLSFYIFISMGFYGSSFNVLRQYIAMGIVLFSIKYVKERKIKEFLIVLLCAVMFHKTAICFIIVYPIYNIKVERAHLIWIGLISLILGLTSKFLITSILSFTSYSKYFSKIGAGLGNGSGDGNLMLLILVITSAVIFRDELDKIDENSNLWINMMIIAMFINIFALQLAIFERLMRYFMLSIIILIPNTIKAQKSNILKNVGNIAIVLLTGYYYFGIIMSSNSSSGGIIPYLFMWQ